MAAPNVRAVVIMLIVYEESFSSVLTQQCAPQHPHTHRSHLSQPKETGVDRWLQGQESSRRSAVENEEENEEAKVGAGDRPDGQD